VTHKDHLHAANAQEPALVHSTHMQPTVEEKLQSGFDADEELIMPLPVLSSDEEEEINGAQQNNDYSMPSGSAGLRVETFLEAVVANGEAASIGAATSLFDINFWQAEAASVGLHVVELSAASAPAASATATQCRRSLDRRGYLQSPPLYDNDDPALVGLRAALARLKQRGFAPAFIYMFDEAWLVLERCWRLLGDVLVPDAAAGTGASQLVLEPSVFAHALSRPRSMEEEKAAAEEEDEAGASAASAEIQRFSYLGGNFGLPHRDHSSADCFDEDGRPTLLSLWCPLTPVSQDNGCMFVLPKEFDPLLHASDAPHHLRPYDQHSGCLRFGLGGAVSLAPCDAGCALAWHGSLVHWGGACSRHSELPPRASLTAGLRLRTAHRTQLQREQSRHELSIEELPPPLETRVRMVAASLLVYKYWYGLSGALPPRFLPPEERER
jgi:hypothetical protein